MLKAVLFDLDGTVLASKQGVFNSIAYALDELGLPMPSEDELLAFLGPPISQGFEEVCRVPRKMVEEAIQLYREYYNRQGKFEAEIYAGMRELLQDLTAQGKDCYITTSKPHHFAKPILEHFEMLAYFKEVYGSELDGTRGSKAEVLAFCLQENHLQPHEAILVGDRHFDVFGAEKLEMPCIGVLYGYGCREELEEAGAAYIAEDMQSLGILLQSL